MQSALTWLGIDWDAFSVQSEQAAAHASALDHLADQGLLYPCRCSRSEVRQSNLPAVDGGWRYPGTCRHRDLPAGGWRECGDVLRLKLPAGRVTPLDEGGVDLAQTPAVEMGDPILRRRDGSIAYHLAVVVDDANQGITRVVRGADLASSTAIQSVLQNRLGIPHPIYRHHLLLLEERGTKLAKLHGAVGWRQLEPIYSAPQLCGLLAHWCGLLSEPLDITPAELVADFSWSRVRRRDLGLRWTGQELALL